MYSRLKMLVGLSFIYQTRLVRVIVVKNALSDINASLSSKRVSTEAHKEGISAEHSMCQIYSPEVACKKLNDI